MSNDDNTSRTVAQLARLHCDDETYANLMQTNKDMKEELTDEQLLVRKYTKYGEYVKTILDISKKCVGKNLIKESGIDEDTLNEFKKRYNIKANDLSTYGSSLFGKKKDDFLLEFLEVIPFECFTRSDMTRVVDLYFDDLIATKQPCNELIDHGGMMQIVDIRLMQDDDMMVNIRNVVKAKFIIETALMIAFKLARKDWLDKETLKSFNKRMKHYIHISHDDDANDLWRKLKKLVKQRESA